MQTTQEDPVEHYRRCARAARRLFATEDGKRLLAHLRRTFGMDEPSARPGMRNEEVWMTEGMKAPLRHLDRLLTDDLENPPPLRARR